MRNVTALLLLVVVAMVVAAPVWAITPNPDNCPSGLDYLLWHMNDAGGTNAVWADTAWAGAMNGIGTGTSTAGIFGTAARGIADAGIVSPVFSSARGHEFTAECWVMWPTGTNPQAANQLLFDRRSPNNVWYAKIGVMSTGGVAGTVEFAAWVAGGTGGAVNSGPCNFVNNQWYHIAITCQNIAQNNNVIKIYVTPAPAPGVPIGNPILKVSSDTVLKPDLTPMWPTGYGDMPATTGTGTPLRVGGGVTGPAGRAFDGCIDEVRYAEGAAGAGACRTTFDSFAPSVSPDTATVPWGQTQQFSYDTANGPSTWQVVGESVPGQVGTIDSNSGLFTAIGPGTCYVRATDAALATDTSSTITVPVPVVAPDTATLAPQSTQQFTFNTLAQPVTWEVVEESTPGVGTIDSSGVFTALVPGTCRIRATDTRTFTDVTELITVANPVITPSPARVVLGYTAQFTATPVTGTVTWSVINESGGVGTVGTIDATTGLFTSVGVGTCQVRVTDSASNVATSNVTVVATNTHAYTTDANTISLYHLDEATGTVWSDVSGNNLTANSVAAITPAGHVAGWSGNAAGEFNYLNTTDPSYITSIASSPNLYNNLATTVECWVYFPAGVDILGATALPSMRGILSQRVGGTNWALMAGSYNGSPATAVPGGVTFAYWSSGPAPITNQFIASTSQVFFNEIWYHVAVTYQPLGTTPETYEVKIYVTPEGTTTPQLVATSVSNQKMMTVASGIVIGSESNAARKSIGYVDEVRISKGVRTTEEMSWTLGAYSEMVAKPVITPAGGNFAAPQNVTIACATAGADIYYTTDGTDPSTTTSGTLYTGAFQVSTTTTVKARAFKATLAPSYYAAATLNFPTCNRPASILQGAAVIDGDLSEWSSATWAPLDQNYNATATDITEAYYAAKWASNKVYVAAKVRDTAHHFTDVYDAWNTRDAVEFYIHTTGTGPVAYSATQADAQEYPVGFKTDATTLWSCISGGTAIPSGAFEVAGTIDGEWLCYEAAMTPYQFFSLSGTGSIISPLSAGMVIGLDVTAVGHNGTAYTGMKAENLLLDKWNDYNKLGLHGLQSLTFTAVNIGQAKTAANGSGVVVSGVVSATFTDCFYIENTDRTYGIRVGQKNHGRTAGEVVTVTGTIETLNSGERYIVPTSPVSDDGDGEILPLGMTNKVLGGGPVGTPPNGQVGVAGAGGTNTIGLLVQTTGRVGAKGDDWYMIDDGSAVSVKVYGSVPTGTPYLSVEGICSCEKDLAGDVQRVVLATATVDNTP